jgi:hypothetical protein
MIKVTTCTMLSLIDTGEQFGSTGNYQVTTVNKYNPIVSSINLPLAMYVFEQHVQKISSFYIEHNGNQKLIDFFINTGY